jgi:phage recombination protein Bet
MTTTNGAATTLARKDDNFFDDETIGLIRRTIVPGATDDEFMSLMAVARLRRLNPLLKQIHFVKRQTYDDTAKEYVMRWAFQVAIDGFRLIAERTGAYDGQDEPEYELAPDGSIIRCRVKIYRNDKTRPFVGIADWTEFVQKKRDGGVTAMWRDKPRLMLAKCAEAMGFRKAFPEETSGFYIEEEMKRDEMEGEVVPTLGGTVNGKRATTTAAPTTPKQLASAEASKAAAAELLKALETCDERAGVLRIGAQIDERATRGELLIQDRATCLGGYTDALKRVAKPRSPPATPPANAPPAQGGVA